MSIRLILNFSRLFVFVTSAEELAANGRGLPKTGTVGAPWSLILLFEVNILKENN